MMENNSWLIFYAINAVAIALLVVSVIDGLGRKQSLLKVMRQLGWPLYLVVGSLLWLLFADQIV